MKERYVPPAIISEKKLELKVLYAGCALQDEFTDPCQENIGAS